MYLSRLDHLRFLAALMVLSWHTLHRFISVTYVPRFFALSIFEEGHTGVALFMTLSGFIFMALARDKEIVYADFIRNRLLRIAPLFIFWFTLQVWTLPAFDMTTAVVALLTMNDPANAVPGVGWTILVEFQFYFLFPFLLRFYRQRGMRILLGILLLAFVFRLAVFLTSGTVQKISYWSFFGRIDQFILGMIACELYHRWPGFFRNGWLFAGSVLGWMLLVHQFNLLGGYSNYHGRYPSGSRMWVIIPTLEGTAYALWMTCWLASPIRLPRKLDTALAWMGKLSFSFYLNHGMMIVVCVKLLKKYPRLVPTDFTGAMAVTFLFVLPLTTLVSALTYYVIELPFLSMRRNYLLASAEQQQAPSRLAA